MLNFGLVGFGRIGKRHLPLILRFGNLVAVCDNDQEILKTAKFSSQILVYNSLDDFLKIKHNIDIVVVCTPNYLHASQSIALLNFGYHVLCEKPMALTVSECLLMNSAAKTNNKKLFVVKQNRFNPPVVKLKELIENDSLGKIYSIQVNGFWNRNEDYFRDSWTANKEKAGGILHTQFSHFLDISSWLFGELIEVQTMGSRQSERKDFNYEDTFIINGRFSSGALANFHFSINSYAKNMEGSITVLAEKGSYKIGGQYLNTLDYYCLSEIDKIEIEVSAKANNYGTYSGSMSNHHLVYKNITEVLQGVRVPATTGEDGMKTLEMIEQIIHCNNDISTE